jgi:hypothetical protein
MESRQLAYKVYRYLNLVHLLHYQGKSVWLSQLDEDHLVTLGLLTVAELKALSPAKNKKRDTVLGWLSDTVLHRAALPAHQF